MQREPEPDDRQRVDLEEPDAAPVRAPTAGGYRVRGDLEVRVADLERQVHDMEQDAATMRAEVRAARSQLAVHRAARGVSSAGVGAFLGVLAGSVGLAATGLTPVLIMPTVLGFLFGFLWGVFARPNDDGFPPAPPPRTFR